MELLQFVELWKRYLQILQNSGHRLFLCPHNTHQDRNRIKSEFYNISYFPNVTGSVDCTHIPTVHIVTWWSDFFRGADSSPDKSKLWIIISIRLILPAMANNATTHSQDTAICSHQDSAEHLDPPPRTRRGRGQTKSCQGFQTARMEDKCRKEGAKT